MPRTIIDKNKLLLRPATADDDVTIKQMVRQARLDPTSLKWQHFTIAEYEGEIIAIGQVKQHPGCQEIGSFATKPAYQGQGIATQIMDALEAQAGRPLYLLCLQKMVPFYEKHGYHTISWWRVPWFLKVKLLPAVVARLFGIRVHAMQKD